MTVMKRRVSASAIAATSPRPCAAGRQLCRQRVSVNWSKVTSAKAGGGMAALVAAAKAEAEPERDHVAAATGPTTASRSVGLPQKYGWRSTVRIPTAPALRRSQALEQTRAAAGAGCDRRRPVASPCQGIQSLVSPYKVATWRQHPGAAKAANGLVQRLRRILSFGCDMTVVTTCPTSWKALRARSTRATSPSTARSARPRPRPTRYGPLAEYGGSLSNAQPGISFFQTLKSDGNFNSTDCNSPSVIEAHQCPILINWDYLNSAKSYGLPANIAAHWKVVDPTGTAFAGYYVQAISRAAPHPAAARLWEEFLVLDHRPEHLARGWRSSDRASGDGEGQDREQGGLFGPPEGLRDDRFANGR